MKDYAKKTTRTTSKARTSRRPAKNNPQPNTWPGNLLLLLALIFAGFACFHLIQKHVLPLLKSKNNTTAASTIAPKTEKQTPNIIAPQDNHKNPDKTATQTTQDDQPKFDFYKLLSQATVRIPANNTLSNTTTINKPNTETSATPTYVLQIASLHHKQDANQVRQTLKAAGYTNTFLQPYQAPDHSTWYRVLIGPFYQLKNAQAEQNKLDAQQTEALLTTLK